ncbi:MAG TPA: Mov34/MPN/PAD-1 family protein [Candidatus Tectomicrobia bacterium]|nr:Mov34/MPN/PAD-1 family protein [Candidatus Tectomicrobia bacterium]
MPVTVYIPTPFRRATGNRDRVEVAARDVGGALDELERTYAGLKGLVRNERGELHHHVALYVNGEAVEGPDAPLRDGDEVAIIPALAGGRGPVVTAEELEAIHAQAAREYPFEACGVILARGDERRLLACRNAQNELHNRDPERYPRDARTAYYIDPKDLLRIGQLEREGFAVAVIYHSHVDAGAYFSETDRRQALVAGQPAYPSATYLVTSVERGQVRATAAFRWDEGARDFVAVELA